MRSLCLFFLFIILLFLFECIFIFLSLKNFGIWIFFRLGFGCCWIFWILSFSLEIFAFSAFGLGTIAFLVCIIVINFSSLTTFVTIITPTIFTFVFRFPRFCMPYCLLNISFILKVVNRLPDILQSDQKSINLVLLLLLYSFKFELFSFCFYWIYFFLIVLISLFKLGDTFIYPAEFFNKCIIILV